MSMKPSESEFPGRMVIFLGVLGFILWSLTSRPEASQFDRNDPALSGATDILMLQAPRSIHSMVSDWNPTSVFSELGANVLFDRVKSILCRFPSRMDPVEIDRLSKMLVMEGKRANIDPMFLAAVIRVESAFHAGAISNKGARGLMQVMPATGQEVAKWMGISWIGAHQLHDPEINVRLGVNYLRWLLDIYSGNYKYALTAYNRGPRNLRSIVRQYGELRSEFTDYFEKIIQAYRGYLRKYAKSGSVFLAAG